MSLLCLAITVQTLSLVSLYSIQSGQLLLSQKQSTLDLSCISQAKGMIEHNEYIDRCQLSKQKIKQVSKSIQDIDVLFTDCDTYILCSYQKQDRYIEMKVYYQGDLICGLDIDSH